MNIFSFINARSFLKLAGDCIFLGNIVKTGLQSACVWDYFQLQLIHI